MVFNSLVFITFFAIVALFHHSSASWRAKKIALFVASGAFYGAWNPPFLLLLWGATLLDYFSALAMERSKTLRARRFFLGLSLLGNLGMLSLFKYGRFFVANFAALVHSIGIDWQPPAWDVVLPIGISFYTFQTLSYTIDVYRGQLQARRSLLDFALFVSFFPQLVAGPIVRAKAFLPQLDDEKRGTLAHWSSGLTLLVIGLFQKLVLADSILAPMADSAFLADGSHGFADSWSGTLAFSGQIFFDFAGYSLCAIGVARCLGFELTDNFQNPYGAFGFSDFWRRWHISLSSWLRDYLYIPLGGNRHGRPRTEINLLLTMLIGGLWHGAAWTFVIWGALHGAYLIGERRLRGSKTTEPTNPVRLALGIAVTYVLVCFAWVFFRAADFTTAWEMVRAMVGVSTDTPGTLASRIRTVLVIVTVCGMLWLQIARRRRHIDESLASMSPIVRGVMLGTMLFLIAVAGGGQRAFIYFQF